MDMPPQKNMTKNDHDSVGGVRVRCWAHRSLRAGGQDTHMAPDGALRLFCGAGSELDQLPRRNEKRHPDGLPAWRFESSALRHICAWRAVLRQPYANSHFVARFEGILCHPLPGQRVGAGDFDKPSDYVAVFPIYVQVKEGVRIDPFDSRNYTLKRNELSGVKVYGLAVMRHKRQSQEEHADRNHGSGCHFAAPPGFLGRSSDSLSSIDVSC